MIKNSNILDEHLFEVVCTIEEITEIVIKLVSKFIKIYILNEKINT